MKLLIISCVYCLFLTLPLYSQDLEIAQSENNSSCVWYQGSRSLGPGRMTIQFYNACDRAVNIYVCLTDSFGESQLIKSAGRVPAFGRISLFPFIDRAPQSLHWSAARGTPSIPGPCSATTTEN
ncbi:MAG: hypothetical protein Tsb0021_12040 [Chlamydiales bacterium]